VNDLNWLAKHRFLEAVRHEYSWSFVFDGSAGVSAGCLWRLLENGGIQRTSLDDGHKFGLPEPVDAVIEVNQRIAGAVVEAIVLHEGTLDLEIRFDTGHVLQLIPDSAGYEAWNANDRTREFIAVGGGNLTAFDRSPEA
jgi:hypothetical protein